MSKPDIFIASYAIDKAYWEHFSDKDDFREHIKNQLGRNLAERIFQECQSGEKIVTVGNTYKKEIPELYHVEIREEVRIEDLVRCKDCIHSSENGGSDCPIEWHKPIQMYGFCHFGERRSG